MARYSTDTLRAPLTRPSTQLLPTPSLSYRLRLTKPATERARYRILKNETKLLERYPETVGRTSPKAGVCKGLAPGSTRREENRTHSLLPTPNIVSSQDPPQTLTNTCFQLEPAPGVTHVQTPSADLHLSATRIKHKWKLSSICYSRCMQNLPLGVGGWRRDSGNTTSLSIQPCLSSDLELGVCSFLRCDLRLLGYIPSTLIL